MDGIIGQIVNFSQFLLSSRLMSYPYISKDFVQTFHKVFFFIKWNNFEG